MLSRHMPLWWPLPSRSHILRHCKGESIQTRIMAGKAKVRKLQRTTHLPMLQQLMTELWMITASAAVAVTPFVAATMQY